MAAQPRFCGRCYLLEPETGHALSLSLWQDEAALAAADRAQSTGPADGRISRETRPSVHIESVF
jgi:hypothetical protein